MAELLVFDADIDDAETRETELSARLAAARRSDWTLLPAFSSRNAMLAHVAKDIDPATPCIALIDLDAASDPALGYRIVACIRRHEELCLRCRPVIYTRHEQLSSIQQARTVGAYAYVSHRYLRLDPTGGRLCGLLDQLASQPCGPLVGTPVDFVALTDPTTPPEAIKDPHVATSELAAAFRRYFPAEELKKDDLAILASRVRGKRDDETALELGLPTRSVRNRIQELRNAAWASLSAGRSAFETVAARFLADPETGPQLTPPEIPSFTGLMPLIERDGTIRLGAFLDDQSHRALVELRRQLPVEMSEGKIKLEEIERAYNEIVEAVSAEIGEPARVTDALVRRACEQLRDAVWDARRSSAPAGGRPQ